MHAQARAPGLPENVTVTLAPQARASRLECRCATPLGRRPARHATFALATFALLAGAACSSSEGLFGGDKVDYRSTAVKARPLDVPPDLTQLARESRYQPVGAGGAVSAASAASAAAAAAPVVAAAAAAAVAPGRLENMRIERDGQQRWLVVSQQTPEQLWPKIKSFWEKTGFTLALDNPQAGLMETNWSENRAKLPKDAVRNLLGSLLSSLYDTGERDLFRTRLERNGDGSVEIYISHRGVEEVGSGPSRDQFSWQVRPSDPGLEAEMLARLMLALAPANTADAAALPAPQTVAAAVAAVTGVPQPPARARVIQSGERATMEIDEPFDRAWRRVGLVLDRGGFTVEDRDRAAGIYYVRYSDPRVAGQDEPNFFARVFGGVKDPQTPVRYRIVLKGTAAKTTVDVLTSDGGTASGENGQRIIARLVEDLK